MSLNRDQLLELVIVKHELEGTDAALVREVVMKTHEVQSRPDYGERYDEEPCDEVEARLEQLLNRSMPPAVSAALTEYYHCVAKL